LTKLYARNNKWRNNLTAQTPTTTRPSKEMQIYDQIPSTDEALFPYKVGTSSSRCLFSTIKRKNKSQIMII
jgi:hypothetical protein